LFDPAGARVALREAPAAPPPPPPPQNFSFFHTLLQNIAIFSLDTNKRPGDLC